MIWSWHEKSIHNAELPPTLSFSFTLLEGLVNLGTLLVGVEFYTMPHQLWHMYNHFVGKVTTGVNAP
jgi:hypothetical protein